MNTRKTNYVTTSVIVITLLSVGFAIIAFTQSKATENRLSFKGSTNKEEFILGEPVTVKFQVINEGKDPVKIHRGGVETGYLKILISSKDKDYKQYIGYGWGRIMGRMSSLASGDIHKYQDATILWNGKPNVSNLSEYAAKEVLKDKILTEYAFQEPNVYFIKGLSYFGENATPIESEPIQISINEPVGDDLEVWNQIKGNREIALLMQTGEFDTSKDEEKAQLINEVEQIIVKYPNSAYSNYLKPNLEEFKANEAKRKEILQQTRKN